MHGLSSYPTGTAILQPLLAWLLSKGGCLTYSTKREGRKEGREGERKPGRKGKRERKRQNKRGNLCLQHQVHYTAIISCVIAQVGLCVRLI